MTVDTKGCRGPRPLGLSVHFRLLNTFNIRFYPTVAGVKFQDINTVNQKLVILLISMYCL